MGAENGEQKDAEKRRFRSEDLKKTESTGFSCASALYQN
jgi:hypothetical protein